MTSRTGNFWFSSSTLTLRWKLRVRPSVCLLSDFNFLFSLFLLFFQIISVGNRAGLIDDAFNLARWVSSCVDDRVHLDSQEGIQKSLRAVLTRQVEAGDLCGVSCAQSLIQFSLDLSAFHTQSCGLQFGYWQISSSTSVTAGFFFLSLHLSVWYIHDCPPQLNTPIWPMSVFVHVVLKSPISTSLRSLKQFINRFEAEERWRLADIWQIVLSWKQF